MTDQDRMAERAEMLRLLDASSRDRAVFAVDPAGRVRSWSASAEQLLGWSATEIVGQPAPVLVAFAGSTPGPSDDDDRSGRDGWMPRQDGTSLAVRVIEHESPGGGSIRLVVDRSEWWDAEQARREATARTRALFEHSAIGIAVTNVVGRFLEANPVFAETTGYTSAELLTRNIAAITHPDDMPPTFAQIGQLLRGSNPSFTIERRLIRRDGQAAWVRDNFILVRDDAGEPTQFVILSQPIDPRRLAESQIAEQVQLLEYGRDVNLVVTESSDLRRMLNRCAELTVWHLRGAFARIWTLDPTGQTLELQASAGLYTHIEGDHQFIPVGQFKIGRIAATREAHLTNAVIGDPLVPAQDWAAREGIVAFAGYPLIVDDKLVGVMALFARHPLSQATLRAMASVADSVSLGIERKQAADRLVVEQEKLRVTLASIGDGIIATAMDGRITLLNGVAEQLTGWREAEARGRPMAEVFRIINESTREPAANPIDRVIAEGVIVGLANHTVLIARDGTETAIEDSAAPIRDARGNAIGTVMVFRDATEERRHAAELRASEEQFRQLAGSIAQLAWMAQPDGHIFWYNQRWYDYTGTTFEQMEGWGWRSVHDPAVLPSVEARFRQCLADSEPFEMVFPLRGADGQFRPFLTRAAPLKDAEGRIVRWVGTNTDISAERLLHRELKTFASLIANSNDLVAVSRLDGVPRFMNEAGLRMIGLDGPDQMAATPVPDYFFAEDLDFVTNRFLPEVLRTGRGEVEIRFRHQKTGAAVWMIYHVFVLSDDDGAPTAFATVSRDITERKRAEDELREAKEEAEHANKAKDHFLAILSHELRTPLNPILLATTSMSDPAPDAEEVRATLSMIRQNVLLQSRLIDDLLDVMRIVRGKMPLHWEIADGHRLIHQSQQICQSEVFGKELRLVTELGAKVHHLNADPARLQQVFWNLIKNAVKFTPGGGTITIRTTNEQVDETNQLVIEFADTGIGIDPAVLPLVFDPFQQGETRITRKFGGLGLGLAICKGVVEAHGGTITARSDGPGCGTTFRVVLNALAESALAEKNAEPKLSRPDDIPARLTKLQILVVEDEPATLRLMARLLRRLGHEIITAGSVAAGLDAVENHQLDLIISDIGLPDGTGLDLMRQVVTLRGLTPAIALTGYGMEEDIVRSRAAGFTTHMTKPIDFTKLEVMIRQVAPRGG